MPSLLEIQESFAAGMRAGQMGAVAPAVLSDRIRAEDRLRIYQNHYSVTLTEALETTYPVALRLVGPTFFRWIASRYIAEFPPTEPCLFAYGAGFSGVLAGLSDCANVPYLPDVARFEWAVNRAFHAPDGSAIEAQSLAALPVDSYGRLTFRLDSACGLFESRFPVSRIWKLNQPDADPSLVLDVADGGERLLICRIDDDAVWRPVDVAEFAFIGALLRGHTLLEANAAASAAGEFDLTSALAALLDARLVSGFTLRSTKP